MKGGNLKMNITLTKETNKLIEAHRAIDKKGADDMWAVLDKWKEPSMINKYQPEALISECNAELNEVISECRKADTLLNQKLKNEVSNAKAKVIPCCITSITKPNDYAMQVNNALQFITLEGEELTDEKAYNILKQFIEDYEQMELFAAVVEKQVGTEKFINANGTCFFKKTFGKYSRAKAIINLFNEIEALSENLFIIPKVASNTFIINAHYFNVVKDGYAEIADEQNILNLLAELDIALKDVIEPIK